MTELAVPPRRIVAERLLIEAYEPAHAELLKEAMDSSLEHLRVFMEWAWHVPEPLGEVEERLGDFSRRFDLGEDWIYGMFTPDGTELVGGVGLYRRVGPAAVEVGYWVRASRLRRGFATEAAAALTRVAFQCCRAVRAEIHIDPANAASLAIPERLGYLREATLRQRLPPVRPSEKHRDVVIFSLLAEEYPSSPAAALPVETLAPPARAEEP